MWGGRPTGKDFLAYLLILISFRVVDLIDTERQAPIEKRDTDDHRHNIQLNLGQDEDKSNLKNINKRETDDEQVPLDADGNPHGAVRRSLEEWDTPQLSREAWEGDSYNPYTGLGLQAGYRKVPATDIINPKGQIKCAFPGEMFYFWEVDVRCAICVCLISSEGVKAVCVSCSTCIRGQPIIPTIPPSTAGLPTIATSTYAPPPTWTWAPTTLPPWTYETTAFPPWTWETTTSPSWTWEPTTPSSWTEHWPTEVTQEPPIYTSVQPPHDHPQHKSCRPLPENVPFVNPMNPCQKCICTIVKDSFGADVVSITCEEIPECHHAVTTQAPPDACQNMPINVWFPHPYYYDEICICTTVEDKRIHVENIRIMCVKIPDQQSSTPQNIITSSEPPFTYPPPTTQPDWPFTYPTQSPTWPPFTTQYPPTIYTSTYRPPSSPSTPKPVFPPNHKSCRPYRPNVPFDHPWDSCQKCVCREFQDQNSIYVEVDCYTKQECCIEIPFGTERHPIEHFPRHKGDITVPDQLCEGKPVGAVFPFPGDSCYSCVCYLDGSYVYPACKRKQTQACANGQGNIQLIPYGHSESHAIANAETWNFGGQGQSQSQAAAQAHAQSAAQAHAQAAAQAQAAQAQAAAQAHALANKQAVAQAQAYAAAQAQANKQAVAAQAQANALAGTNSHQTLPYWYNGKVPRNIVSPTHTQSEAQASANANVQSINGLYGASAANANAHALANQYGRPNYGAAQAAANAQTNVQNLGYLNNYAPNAGRLYSRDIAKANAHADALSGSHAKADASAEAESLQSNYPGYGGWAQGHANANALSYNKPGGRLSSRDIAQAIANAESSASNINSNIPNWLNQRPSYGGGNTNAESAASADASADSVVKQYGRPAVYGAPWGPVNGASQAHANAHADAYSNTYVRPLNSDEHSVYQDGSRCQYEGDKYTEKCSACICYKSRTNGQLYARCTDQPCQ